ncbi:MAG: LemA family protein [Candidatus Diapherotrites archaeon]|uniref:LemA family protein n=1 Tax=Candidatus Iainarchaeum sp. TaxID=3101447 RepID=A0A939C4F9_9ARCH|nr:LemA family protein [Candidatus Diapherotrites archaeon]
MELLELIGLAVIAVIVLLAVILVVIYNSLIGLQKRVDNAWAQIDVQLKRRADLIPNLIETVKGYAKFEKKVLTDVTKARTAIMSAKNPAESAKADNMLAGALKTIFAVAEAYPKLQASENFKSLQEEFATTENKIAYARQFYNDSAMQFNTAIAQVPGNIVAAIFGLAKPRQYFEIAEADRKPVKADFSDLA